MKKEQIRNIIIKNGESIVNFRSSNSKKLKYVVCTTDFDNPYIRSKKIPGEQSDKILVFCWDSDSFKQLNTELVTSVEPLDKVLKGHNAR
jgi:hypothetical protein